jgi:hypothetical protein
MVEIAILPEPLVIRFFRHGMSLSAASDLR